MGTEGQLLGGVVDPVIDLTGTVSTESESNDTKATADGPIGLSTWGSTSGNQEPDWYYFEVLRSGTVTITKARTWAEFQSTEYDLDWSVSKDGTTVATGTGSGSFSVTAGTYYIELDPLQVADYYDLNLSAQNSTEYATRYFLKDHLGSTRAIVDEIGTHLASYDYYPFGLEMPGRSSSSGTQIDSYKYTGHEHDEETGIAIIHMNARGMDPAIGRMLQVDRMHEKYPAYTPYHYGANNPLFYVDMTGDTIVVAGSDEFKQTVNETLEFIKNSGELGSELIGLLESNAATITIKEASNPMNNFFDPSTNEINWNPDHAVETDGVASSPATILTHEAGHALWRNYNSETAYEQFRDRNTNSVNPLIGNAHEEKVILMIEGPFKVDIGEKQRNCHSNCSNIKVYKVKTPTSTEKK